MYGYEDYKEYMKIIEELKGIKIDVDLPISELIEEELIDFNSDNYIPLDPDGFGYRYQKELPPPIPGSSARLGK